MLFGQVHDLAVYQHVHRRAGLEPDLQRPFGRPAEGRFPRQ